MFFNKEFRLKLKRIQIKIVLWAGLCLILTTAIITAYSAIVIRNQANSARNEAIEVGKRIAEYRSAKLSKELQQNLEVAMIAGRTLSQTLSGIPDTKSDLELDRERINGTLRMVLDKNPAFVGVYTCWEPNALDGSDSLYTNTDGHDTTGRFIPYWSRDNSGNIGVEALGLYDVEGDGDYYLIPKRTKTECLIDPYVYPVQGEDVLITSLVAPIVVNDSFYGIAGVDLRLDGFQGVVDDVATLYEGTGTIAIISNNGTLAAVTDRPELQGAGLVKIHEDWEKLLERFKDGKTIVEVAEGELSAFVPIKVGESTTLWWVNVQIPEEEITKAADRQMANSMRQLLFMVIIGIIGTLAALTVLWYLARGISLPIVNAATFANTLRLGDITQRVTVTSEDEVGQLAVALNEMAEDMALRADLAATIADGDFTKEVVLASENDVLGKALQDMSSNLNKLIYEISDNSQQINSGSQQVSDASQSLSEGATEQAANLEEISSSLAEIANQTVANEKKSSEANLLTINVKETAEIGNESMQHMVSAMGDIETSSTQISKILKVIDDIAFQTNLLALNAAVEAARAGQHGKGFAVVADEVRNLAGRSAKAAQETGELIENSVTSVKKGLDISNKTANVLSEIVDKVEKTVELVAEIGEASKQQAQGISEVNVGLSQIESITQATAANAEEVAATAEELSSQTLIMNQRLSEFILTDNFDDNKMNQIDQSDRLYLQ
jgi:methyl-accepting chemotaxis protein